jgi:hypothetical protein
VQAGDNEAFPRLDLTADAFAGTALRPKRYPCCIRCFFVAFLQWGLLCPQIIGLQGDSLVLFVTPNKVSSQINLRETQCAQETH